MTRAKPFSFDVVAIGAATRDLFLLSDALHPHASKDAPDGFEACLRMGAKIDIDELTFASGGGATNAAVTFARFGFRTSCVSRVGTDIDGTHVLDDLKKEHIDTHAIQMDAQRPTAFSVILLAGSGSRAILAHRGASKYIDHHAIPWKTLHAPWIYATSFAGSRPLLKEVFTHARETNARIAWNPGSAEIELGLPVLQPYLLRTDILILNREEAAALCLVSPRHLDKIIDILGSLPRIALVLTDGAGGAYAASRGAVWHALPKKVVVKNTTGAGDAFGSGFTASIMKHGDVATALRAGTLNALGVISHMGAKAGILADAPTPKQLAAVRIEQLL